MKDKNKQKLKNINFDHFVWVKNDPSGPLKKTFSQESDDSFDRSFFEMVEKYTSEKEYLNSELYKNENTYFPEIILNELKIIIKTLKDDSASGPGNISNQMLKNLPETFLI
ncbi:hypothetical protein BpHYR1_049890 [Brachionus plicatilis]|uniref:Uncharacterized protein n=1 Tax=Brachionus plicatilis TaxID=10195 RepID=A0A3M7QF33_BRAPC|nr:hypothetical protein BpHYR1_049890 [Brachionus plicatilis]